MFQDIFGVLANPQANAALHALATEHAIARAEQIDRVAGLDSRGFLFANSMALAIGKPFVPVRKAGKLPGCCVGRSYQLEYGEDRLEVQADSIRPGDRILLVDGNTDPTQFSPKWSKCVVLSCADLLATGGTLATACTLVRQCGATVDHCWVVIELSALKGRKRVGEKVESLVNMENIM